MQTPNLEDCYEDINEALAAAVSDRDMKLIEKLLDKGADPTQEDVDYISALGLAAEADSLEVLKLFESKGLKISEYYPDILEAAIGGSGINVVRYVLSKEGVNVNTEYSHWYTPLHWAAEAGDPKIIKFLLSEGANPLAVSKDEDTPLDIVLKNDNYDCAKLLFPFAKDLSPYEKDFPDLVKLEKRRRTQETIDKTYESVEL